MRSVKLRSFFAALLTAIMLFGLLVPVSCVVAAGTPPTKISPPENFAASNYRGSDVVCTLSAPDDLRKLISQTQAERGYSMKILAQVDFKTDNGGWHYSSKWDDLTTYMKYTMNFYNALTGVNGQFLGHDRLTFKSMFPDETNVPVQQAFTSWEWYKSHSMTLRARFAIDFGNKNVVFSDWSKEYVLSNSSTMDYQKIMNENAPTLLSSKIEIKGVAKVPWVALQLAQHPDAIQLFNATSSNSMRTEIWLRKSGEEEFKNIGETSFSPEIINVDVGAYFEKNLPSYDAQAYEVKVRYKIDERAYQQSGVSSLRWLYSQFSNTLSYGMPAWSGASQWAEATLQKASDMGLIPDSMKGADMTQSITREEFAEVALLMYQKVSGITNTTPFSPNPFIDTSNPQVLKAFRLGIAKGYSATEFAPSELINREQVACMLTRAIKLIAPKADYSTAGAPVFLDQSDISDWAYNDCLYMAKKGIIAGADGYFMPKAVTEAQKAIGYANTTREQALIMSVRAVEKTGGTK